MADQPRRQSNTSGLALTLIHRARAAILFERLWPVAMLVVCLIGLFLIVSWLGLWLLLPVWARLIGVVLFGCALVAAAATGVRAGMPDRAAALARLDRDSGLPHRPITSAEDALANAGADTATQVFWALHRKRLQTALDRVHVALPSPRLVDRDRYALRAAVLVALVATAFVAGPEKYGRVASAFVWHGVDTSPGMRIDAWIDPPGYTGKPPLVLLGPKATGTSIVPTSINAPVGSTIVVRVAGSSDLDVKADGGLKVASAKADGAIAGPAAQPQAGTDHRFTLAGDGHLRVDSDQPTPSTFAITAIPDLPPRIALVGSVKPNLRGSMELRYTIDDDYGVTGAEARFANPVVRGRAVTGRTLVEPPKGVLALPPMPGGLGEGKTTLDVSDHPWAGAVVTMTLSTRDEGGNIGESTPITLTLPAKPFNNPLARALVEQRRNLVLDPDDRAGVVASLDALQIAPDAFNVPPAIYLGLHSAQVRLGAAKTDAELVAVADLLWTMALRIENGDLTQTQQDLRAAQKALRDAMDRNASPDEIKRLTEALRQQMDKYLAEMMQKEQRNQAENQDAPRDRNARTVTPQDLKSMMDRMEEAARKGDMAEAQHLLDQLTSIMENLKTAKRGAGQSQATREMNRSMNDLNRMMKEQGDVRDKTFKESQDPSDQDGDQAQDGQDQAGQPDEGNGGQQPGDNPGQGGEGQQPGKGGKGQRGMKGLQGRQQALQEQLNALQRKLRGLGMKGEQGFADAEQAMKQAQGAMGKGQGEEAVDAQGRALQGLQKGAGGLEQQMAQGGQQGDQAQAQGGEQEGDSSQQGEDLDPLGRPRQGRGFAQSRDLDVSGGLAARAQQVLQELRRRLGDPTRSQDEQDYLERLLKRY